jgi:HEAT repeats
MPRCSRCGAALSAEPELPCVQCWEARGDGRLVRLLVTAAEEGSGRAPQLLARIGDPGAAPALREAMSHDEPHIRAAAIGSLGWSGDLGDVAAVATATRDSEQEVRMADEDERVHAIETLAWLGDDRAIEPLHELVVEDLGETFPHYRRGVWQALARIGSVEDVRRMVDAVAGVVAAGADVPGTPDFWSAQRAAGQLWLALHHERPELVQAAGARLYEAAPGLPADARWQGGSGGAQLVDLDPLGERVVPRATLAELGATPWPASPSPPPKFGGQPDWLDQPAWPLGADSAPLVFYGQLPVTIGEQRRTAYVFIDPEGNHWEPLGQANAVVVQPGASCQLETAPLSTGPQLFESMPETDWFRRRSRARPYERFIRLEDGADPESWEWPELAPDTYRRDAPGDWNKLGGTPLFLQGEQLPPGDGWTFAFQFSAAWAGRELADGAECYGFVREDATGAFLWQCH